MKARIFFSVFVCCLLATPNKGFSQTWRKRMLEQIAALQVQIGYVKKGYGILKDGTSLIGNIKGREFNLHRNFFDSLLIVNPAIKNSKRIGDILVLYETMDKRRKALLQLVSTGVLLPEGEHYTLKYLLSNLADRTDAEISQLELTLTNGKLKLTDDERIRELERCYKWMQSMNTYQKILKNNTLMLLSMRGQVLKDTRILRQLYDLDH